MTSPPLTDEIDRALVDIEWFDTPYSTRGRCLFCDNYRGEGHAPGCKVATIVAMLRAPRAVADAREVEALHKVERFARVLAEHGEVGHGMRDALASLDATRSGR